jgi:hypothetical protein
MRKKCIILICLLVLSAALVGCSPEEEQAAAPKNFDFSGTYTGTQTVTAANNSAEGEVTETTIEFTQNDDGTAKIVFGSGDQEGAVGTFDTETGEFFYDTGGEVSLQIAIQFSTDGDAALAQGTITSNQTGEGWTQEVKLDFKRQ